MKRLIWLLLLAGCGREPTAPKPLTCYTYVSDTIGTAAYTVIVTARYPARCP